MTYVLATTETKVRFYEFPHLNFDPIFVLHDSLDLNRITQFHDKASAKNAAIKSGLKTWRYVSF